MAQQLRTLTVNIKSLDQDISDPVIAGAADAAGRTFKLIFDEEAEAQFTDNTKVYLSWVHKQENIKGYNVFTKVSDDPITWEIKWPQAMLHKGDVLACIELVDDVSIAASTNFTIHVLEDPNDGSAFVVSNDFTVFQTAVLEMTNLNTYARKQMQQMRIEFEDMMLRANRYDETVKEIKTTADKSYEMASKAYEKVNTASVTPTELNDAIANAHHLKYSIVDNLPDAADGVDETLYFVAKHHDDDTDEQQYVEYIFLNGHFEKIGDSANDLSDYITSQQLYDAKKEVLTNSKEYTDSELEKFKESFGTETQETIKALGDEIEQRANEYAEGYANKNLELAKQYTDETKETVDADLTEVHRILETKLDSSKVGDIDLTNGTIKDYVDSSTNQLDEKIKERIGDIDENETIADYVQRMVEEGSQEIYDF